MTIVHNTQKSALEYNRVEIYLNDILGSLMGEDLIEVTSPLTSTLCKVIQLGSKTNPLTLTELIGSCVNNEQRRRKKHLSPKCHPIPYKVHYF